MRRELVKYAQGQHEISLRRACHIVGISDSVYRYRPNTQRDDAVILALQDASEQYPAYGFSKLLKVLRRRGHCWNHKRIHRIYCELNMNKRRRGKKRLPTRNPEPLIVPANANHCWSMDFMNDALMCSRRFRTFNIVDDFNREVLAIEIDLSLPAARVIRVLERVIAWRGYPAKLRMDNGPEFISSALAEWAEEHRIKLDFIEPGTPTQNSFVERFNRTYREEVLNMYAFKTLTEVREITERWMREYNEERPHDSLGDLTPWEYLAKNQMPETSNLGCH
jgi:putative transposase